MLSTKHRWDGDARGEGIADGSWLASDVRQFLATLEATNWVAEEPDLHLLPHLQHACSGADTPWRLRATEMVDAVYVVSLDWEGPSLGHLRADVFALLGSIAESVLYVHQRMQEDTICYDIATGMGGEDTPFRSHGHLVQLRVHGASVPAFCAGARRLPSESDS